jgi:predicted membrane-bound spermidine synthase
MPAGFRVECRPVRALALLLTVATGATGLVYEVTWERMLATLLGSHAEATAAVLAFFLGGLAIGYALFGAFTRRVGAGSKQSARELLRSYGVVEASIGAYALCFELLFEGARWLSLHGPAQPGLSFAFDAALSALLVLPGSALMGATIPILTQALSRGVEDSTRIHAAVYGLNTLGAFVGALSASYFLIPALGLIGSLRAMALVNLLAGACYVLLSLGLRTAAAPAPPAVGAAPLRLGVLAAVACLLGFAMMTVQTALIRMGSLALGASLFTFATVVAVFVLCIALGSLIVGLLPRIPARLLPICAWLLFVFLTLLYLPLQDAPYYAHRLRIAFRDHPAAFMPFHVSVLFSLLCVLGPAVALSGALLPLCFDRVRRERGELGDAAGRLYGWNTAGSLCGALIGGYLLFHWLDLTHVYRVALLALAVVAALLTPPPRALPRALLPAAAAAAAALLLALLPAWEPERLSLGAFRMRQPQEASFAGADAFVAAQKKSWSVPFFDDDPTASISVHEVAPNGSSKLSRSIVTNGKSDGSVTGDYPTMAMAALLPAWLARRAERAFVVGYGTGVTTSELAHLDEMREVVVAEISPAVAKAAPLFDYGNQDTSKNPKVRWVQGDAYRVLLRSEGRYDVIASVPSNPWVTGIEQLYSAEFLAAAKQRLSPGGVYCQWFHSYESNAASIGLVLRTYAAVFPHVAVWYGLGNDLLLLGFDDPAHALDLPRLAERASHADFQAGFGRAGISGFAGLLAHELWPVDVLRALDPQGPIHTLMHPRLSHVAAQAFFVGDGGDLPSSANLAAAVVGAHNSLARRYELLRGGLPPAERAQLVRESCALRPSQCVALLAAWRAAEPTSPARDAVLRWIAESHQDRQVNLALPAQLEHFYRADADPPLPATDTARFAREESERFIGYYHHAAPFQRAALERLFARCAASAQADACAEVRREAEAVLGPLVAAPTR